MHIDPPCTVPWGLGVGMARDLDMVPKLSRLCLCEIWELLWRFQNVTVDFMNIPKFHVGFRNGFQNLIGHRSKLWVNMQR